MYTGRVVFSQVMDFLPKHEFNKCVDRYRGKYRVRNFTCLDPFLCMAFAQLTYRESLRDIEICLRASIPCFISVTGGKTNDKIILDELTIALLFKCPWRVELFFKWIKQHLRIKGFYGTSSNAVKTQIWIAINVYVLVAIIKQRLNLARSLNEHYISPFYPGILTRKLQIDLGVSLYVYWHILFRKG